MNKLWNVINTWLPVNEKKFNVFSVQKVMGSVNYF
jgi:hypothetical protein